ncbi:DnaJ domain-containing protein [Thamnocephalis sphaerospora]|uniref:DnaJ domain-containing protein n=1 Tax=Thamnocephalis sphaerospora TaxID=78915 RepID=A0A4P9XVT3_9FUNG|nr:DnaJ domain-containing protein [Thamnocephalis sphaerospora]|eukprot:RKP09520.1 DnaJ domain-containing protein [Thamnocephalis sphaerospora]
MDTGVQQQVQNAEKLRQQGNEQFKLGRFLDAERAYTQAIDTLPSGHAHLIPLYNNRAAARLKNGDHRAATDDCALVITLVGGETSVTRDGVVYVDQLRKALLRRATALQAMERFEEAAREFDRAAGHGAGVAATEGARQCRQARQHATQQQQQRPPPRHDPWSPSFTSSTSTSSPSVSVLRSADVEKSAAVAEMRRKEQQAQQEEQHRFAVKDQVEARVNMWRYQKEDNLRALLCSLDSILWPTAGVKQCGLQDLISPSQVKVRYMRAIARLHPDKVAKDATVEQKIIAQEVFVSLNRAWDAFRTQNNM